MAVEGNTTVIAISVIQLLVTITIIVFCIQSSGAHHSSHGCVVIISDINIIGVWIHVVEMVTESGDSHAREHAEDVTLMFCEFYNTMVIRKRYIQRLYKDKDSYQLEHLDRIVQGLSEGMPARLSNSGG
jgi:hypothetical protein